LITIGNKRKGKEKGCFDSSFLGGESRTGNEGLAHWGGEKVASMQGKKKKT